MSESYDVVVVGGGSVGMPSAYYLAKRGLKVLVIDRRSALGQGDNKAAIGGIRATHSDPAKILLGSRSLEMVTHFKEDFGIDIGWKPGGYLFPVYQTSLAKKLKDLFELQHRYNLAIDWIDREATCNLVPGINADGLLGGTYSPNDGQVSPLLLPVALARIAKDFKISYRFNEKVLDYKIASGKITEVITDKGRYSTTHVVIATGADAASDGRVLGIDIPVTPDAHEAGISAPIQPFLKPLIVDMREGDDGRTANFYFGQNDMGQIIFCYTPKKLFIGDNRESQSEFLPILAKRMIQLLPRTRHLLIRRVWRGCYPMTPDGHPIIDNVPHIKGLTLAVGMCGQGFMLGIGVGQEVASLVIDGHTSLPREAQKGIAFGRNFDASATEALK